MTWAQEFKPTCQTWGRKQGMLGVRRINRIKETSLPCILVQMFLCLHHCPLTGWLVPRDPKERMHTALRAWRVSGLMDEKKKTKELKRIHSQWGEFKEKKTRVKKPLPRRRKARKRTPFSCQHTIFHYKSFGNEYLLGQKKAASAPTWELLTSHVWHMNHISMRLWGECFWSI